MRKFDADMCGIHNIFTTLPTFDGGEYIWNTCHLNIKKWKIPCQAVFNKMEVDEIPPELDWLRKLEIYFDSTETGVSENSCDAQGAANKRGHLQCPCKL